jgi:hypothetical protein
VDASADSDKVDVTFTAGAMLPGGEQELRLIFHTDGEPIVWDEVLSATVCVHVHGRAFDNALLVA